VPVAVFSLGRSQLRRPGAASGASGARGARSSGAAAASPPWSCSVPSPPSERASRRGTVKPGHIRARDVVHDPQGANALLALTLPHRIGGRGGCRARSNLNPANSATKARLRMRLKREKGGRRATVRRWMLGLAIGDVAAQTQDAGQRESFSSLIASTAGFSAHTPVTTDHFLRGGSSHLLGLPGAEVQRVAGTLRDWKQLG
jgi:hypothetical protein